jgi:hypothetical protein
MGKWLAASIVSMTVSCAGVVYGQEHEHMVHPMHGASAGVDGRQLVFFPPEMRDHTLSNMRDHLNALSEVLDAMSNGQYAKASAIADAQLGMDSPSAEGCKDQSSAGVPQMSKPSGMDHQMAKYMPAGMLKVGLTMHESASVFAVEANKAAKTGDIKPALAALSRVTQNCTACHSAFKVQ